MSATTPRLDGCPQACGNTELPWFIEAVPGAIRASYTCADCGERWTTDWAVETVAQMFETRPVTSANGGPAWEDRGGPEGASTPVVPALDRHPCVRGSARRG